MRLHTSAESTVLREYMQTVSLVGKEALHAASVWEIRRAQRSEYIALILVLV